MARRSARRASAHPFLGSGDVGATGGSSIAGPSTAGVVEGIAGRSSLTAGAGDAGAGLPESGFGGGSAGLEVAATGWGRAMGSSAGFGGAGSVRGFAGGTTATSFVGAGPDVAGRLSAGGLGSVGVGGVASSCGFSLSGSCRRVDGFSVASWDGGAGSSLAGASVAFALSSAPLSARRVPEAAGSSVFSTFRVTRWTTSAETRIRNDARAATPTRVSRRALASGSLCQGMFGNRLAPVSGSGPTAYSSPSDADSPPASGVAAFLRPNLGIEAAIAARLIRGNRREEWAWSSRFGSVPAGGVSDGSSPRVGSWSGIARRPSVSRFALGGWRPVRGRRPSRVSW